MRKKIISKTFPELLKESGFGDDADTRRYPYSHTVLVKWTNWQAVDDDKFLGPYISDDKLWIWKENDIIMDENAQGDDFNPEIQFRFFQIKNGKLKLIAKTGKYGWGNEMFPLIDYLLRENL